MNNVKVGSRIRIVDMKEEPDYCGREGTVLAIDDAGQPHGTWGGLAIIPEADIFEVVS